MKDIQSSVPGFPMFGPNSAFAKRKLRDYIRSVIPDYLEVESPSVASADLFERSGHLEHYRENMYDLGNNMFLKPMNCPYHIGFYNQGIKSYRNLPYRIAEFGKVFRKENSGAISSFRYCQFEQDDGHVFVAMAGLRDEINKMLNLFDKVYKHFDLKYSIELSCRGAKKIGDDDQWSKAEQELGNILNDRNVDFKIQDDEAAFYGPKIDFKVLDSRGRPWQLGTIQLDFFLPARFDCKFISAENKSEVPVLIHRAILGSLERFMQILQNLDKVPDELIRNLDYFIPIKEEFLDHIISHGRHEIDRNFDSLLAERIKNARLLGFRYYCIIGQKEIDNKIFNKQKVKYE